jgi:uncharacterized protein DUF5681
MRGLRKKQATDNTEKQMNLKPFKPGQSGNPKGRPKGPRNRLGTQFLEALEADFNRFGPHAIVLREANINVEANEAFVELWRRISDGLGDELANMDAEQAPASFVRNPTAVRPAVP